MRDIRLEEAGGIKTINLGCQLPARFRTWKQFYEYIEDKHPELLGVGSIRFQYSTTAAEVQTLLTFTEYDDLQGALAMEQITVDQCPDLLIFEYNIPMQHLKSMCFDEIWEGLVTRKVVYELKRLLALSISPHQYEAVELQKPLTDLMKIAKPDKN